MASREQIAARAYEIWLARGGSHGRAADDWLEAERQLARFTVVLADPGKNQIGVIKHLRVITGLELEQVRDLVKQAPQQVKADVTAAEAESIRQQLGSLGARVEIR